MKKKKDPCVYCGNRAYLTDPTAGLICYECIKTHRREPTAKDKQRYEALWREEDELKKQEHAIHAQFDLGPKGFWAESEKNDMLRKRLQEVQARQRLIYPEKRFLQDMFNFPTWGLIPEEAKRREEDFIYGLTGIRPHRQPLSESEQIRDARRILEQIASDPTASLSIKQMVQGFRKKRPSSAD